MISNPRTALIRVCFGLLALFAIGEASLAAEIKGNAYPCPTAKDANTKETCFWHQAVVAIPKGWTADAAWTQRYRALTMFPNGNKGRDQPLIYLRAHSGEKDLDLEKYISVAQQRWKASMPTSTIEPQADLVRPGKPTIKLFLYKNPSVPEQAFELTAFTKDVDKAHPEQTYFFQGVLVSPSMTQIQKAKPAFMELLGKL
jgi:hypothetical protein